MPTRRAVCFSLAMLTAHVLASALSASAAEPAEAEPETITIAGREYRVIADEVFRKMGFDFPDVAPQQNAASDYLKAINACKPWHGRTNREPLDVVAEGWPDDDNELREYVAENQETLKHLRAGAAKRTSHFPFLEAPPGALAGQEQLIFGAPHLPLYRQERELARFLRFVGFMHEHDGDPAVAMDTYLTAVALGVHVSQDSRLMDVLVSVAICRIGTKGMRLCAVERDVPEQVLLGAQKQLASLRALRPSHLAIIRCERVQSRAVMEYLFGLDGAPPPRVQARIREADTEFWDALEAVAELPPPEYLKPKTPASKTRHDRLRRALNRTQEAVSGIDSMAPLAERRAIMEYPLLCGKQDLSWTVADVFLALARYKATHGEYPQSLDEVKELMLSDGIDPFSGGRLKYRLEADGSFTLWSVGENLKDDGGKREEGKSRWQGADYVWSSRSASGAK